jgi:hypothetical protein
MQVKKIAIPVAVLALISYAQVCAQADETVTTMTRTTTTSLGEPTTLAASEVPGSVVYFYTAPPAVLVTTIDMRRKELEKIITAARDRGEITPAKSAAMKIELQRIAHQTGSNTISYPAALMLAQDLDMIGVQYGTVVTTAPAYVPIIAGSRFTISTGQTYQLDDLSMRRAGLEAKITKDLIQGRLSEIRAEELRAQLSNIGTEANLYTSSGNFDAKESRRLYDAFDHVASEIEKSAGKDN